jgi:hypothetical protein
MDLVYCGIAILFFLLTSGLVRLCDRLSDHAPEKHS